MNKFFAVLAIAGVAYFNANAQSVKPKVCGSNSNKVCRVSSDKKTTACYPTKYAVNYKVCKGELGYFICCDAAGSYTATIPFLPNSVNREPKEVVYQAPVSGNDDNIDMSAPQSQSYAAPSSSSTNTECTESKGGVKVCYKKGGTPKTK